MKTYDLIVIGSGSGGSVAATYAARVGGRVVLVEKSAARLGGECLHAGCVPSKTLIRASRDANPTWGKVRTRIDRAVAKIMAEQDSPEVYRERGIDTVFGTATLEKNGAVKVGKTRLAAKRVVIATGSQPYVPNLPGLKKAGYETNQTIFSLSKLPKRLAIIGGGPIAIEMAGAFRRLGSQVTVIEHNLCILKHLDEEAALRVEKALRRQGVTVHTSTSVVKVSATARQKTIEVRSAGEKIDVKADTILVAAGRRPVYPPGLERAGVKTGEGGIVVDTKWRTSNKRIYAVGDVTNCASRFTHVAGMAGTQAALHAILGVPIKGKLEAQPFVYFTDPEVAQVGATTVQLEKDGIDHRVYTLPYSDIDKAVADDEKGFIKLVTSPRGRILGATIAGANAGELIGYIARAVDKKQSLPALIGLLLPYPTLSFGLKQLAVEANFDIIGRYRAPLDALRKIRSLL